MNIKNVKLYNADTLEYAGEIVVNSSNWEYVDVINSDLIEMTKGMPLKALLPCLIGFNLVYDMFEEPVEN